MRRNAPSSVLRLSVVGVVVISLFGAMLARLWYLQILAGPSLAVEAQQNRVRLIYSEAPRGRILDRHGQVLVDNDVVAAVVVDRAAVAERPDVLDRLAVLLGITRADLDARLADARFSPFKPVPVADAIAEETLVFLSEHAAEFPGVAAVERTRRRYPHGSLAAQALGYAGQINDRELAARPDEDYRPGDTIGKSGVELAYESDLRGEPSIEKLEVDREGRVLRTLSLKPAVPGNDVVLSIDLGLQQVAEESLAQGLEAARNVFDVEQLKRFLATAGSAVLLDPRDGSVLAMASSPSYDPSAFVDGIPESVFSALQAPENRYPLNNRVIQGLYPPGSTFKLVTARAGLDAGLVSAGQTVEDTGSIKVGNPPRTFQNARGKAHGRVDMVRAMAVSSDVYFYLLGQRFWEGRGRLGQDAIQEVAREMGLGSRTGLDLPFEASGRVSDPARRAADHERNPKAFPEPRWFTGDNINLSVGQGETVVTPLQLASLYSTFTNGGTAHATRIGSEIRRPDGQPVRRIPPRTTSQVPLNPGVTGPVMAGFRAAVSDPTGTAFAAFSGFPLNQIPVGGKTGTAQAPPRQDTALFVGFAPVESPRYVVAVVMEEAGFGSVAAAPVARRILEKAFGLPLSPVVAGAGSE